MSSLQEQLLQIADGLADRGYAVIDNFLSQTEVNNILQADEFKSRKLHFKKAGIGKLQEKQINESIRGDYIQWIAPTSSSEPLKVYFQKLEKLIPFLNQNLFLSLKDTEIHLTAYPVGTFYKRHLDQFKQDDHRKLSIICYLNENWQPEHGGQLRIYLPNETFDILPVSGRMICFRSDLVEHEVLPATRERFSLTGWLVDQPIQ